MRSEVIAKIIKSKDFKVADGQRNIDNLLTDSRTLITPVGTVFFAIPTKRNTGCKYVEELYHKGVSMFVLPSGAGEGLRSEVEGWNDVNVWYVKDVVKALQLIAAAHRDTFGIPVVGITGSNGKTIVKDWLVQLLSPDRKVVASPKSYNSQIGVPLSVWQMKGTDSMAVFEAGIS